MISTDIFGKLHFQSAESSCSMEVETPYRINRDFPGSRGTLLVYLLIFEYTTSMYANVLRFWKSEVQKLIEYSNRRMIGQQELLNISITSPAQWNCTAKSSPPLTSLLLFGFKDKYIRWSIPWKAESCRQFLSLSLYNTTLYNLIWVLLLCNLAVTL